MTVMVYTERPPDRWFLVTSYHDYIAITVSHRSPPSPANSECTIEIENSLPCGNADLRWCPGGDMDNIIVQVTVRDQNNDPIPDCTVRLDLSGECDPQDELGDNVNMAICGQPQRWNTTDVNGYAEFVITGGGCGRFYLNWVVTAECTYPEVELCDETTPNLCAKSPDFTGDLKINFLDTFKYLPQLSSSIGYSGDLSCDGNVNFFDTFQYLPHLANACQGTGFTLPKTTLGDCP